MCCAQKWPRSKFLPNQLKKKICEKKNMITDTEAKIVDVCIGYFTIVLIITIVIRSLSFFTFIL